MIDYDEGEKDPEDPLYAVVVTKPDGIKATNSHEIYIIDHAWTYRINNARTQLKQVPALLNRLANMMGASHLDTDDAIEFVMQEMWRFNQMYALGATNDTNIPIEDRMAIWYVMDELGSAVQHSDDPNFRIVPFIHLPEGVTYSLLFPIRDVNDGEQATRDFVEGNTGALRKALLLPWRYTNFKDVDFTQSEPDTKYFLDGHIEESLPIASASSPEVDRTRPLRVFTTYSMVQQYVNDPLFQIVEREEDADILWLMTHFKTYKEFSEFAPNKFINQFPFENVITIKGTTSQFLFTFLF